jgi:lactoylglutathione lyase
MAENAVAPPEPPVGSRVVAESLTPPTPATQGYRLQHAMLRISNPESSLRFYTELMGMSLIFTLNTGPFVVYYLAYPGPDDQSPADIANTMPSRAGLLELVYVPPKARGQGSADDSPLLGQPACVGFGHLGFYVPSVAEALRRAEAGGYTVVKNLSDLSATTLDLPESVSDIPFHPGFLASFSQVGFIRDPDG